MSKTDVIKCQNNASGPFIVAGKRTPRYILHTPEPYSAAARYVYELALAVSESGLPIDIICPANHQWRDAFDKEPLITAHATAARATNPKHNLLQKVFANLHFLGSTCAGLWRCSRPGDAVHFQYSLHLPFGAALFACAKLRGCSVIYTAHDPLPHKWLLPKFRWIERSALAWMYKVSDAIVVHSDAGKRTITKEFGISPDKVSVIPHGPYELEDGVPGLPASNYIEVLLFGSIRENKGVHLAIEAIQQLHREGVPVRLTIAGSVMNRKEQAYWERCRELIRKCPEPIVVKDEFIPDAELPELLSNCHCFLLPYTQFFSDSGVAFMALANGRVIVSTKAGGLGALLEASGGGIAIEDASVKSIVDALRHAVALGPEQLDRIGAKGREWVLEECGWKKVARKTIALFRTLQKSAKHRVRTASEFAVR